MNVGEWDVQKGRFIGLDALYDGGRWVIDTSGLHATNPNSGLAAGVEANPIPGFWVSPGDARHNIMLGRDAGGQFVRIEATQIADYLVLNGQAPLTEFDDVPVSLRGRIRAHSRGEMRLTLYRMLGSAGQADTQVARAEAKAGEWTVLTLATERVTHPSASDNYSLGLTTVQQGDWFEVRELSVFIGTLP
jgi:hypothetical protein